MSDKQKTEERIVALIDRLEVELPRLLDAKTAEGKLFAGVVLLTPEMDDPNVGQFITKRLVRTPNLSLYNWLFLQFKRIASDLPDYGRHKEEIYGRLGNTVVMAEKAELNLPVEVQVSYVVQDFWEICQDMLEGTFRSLDVAVGPSIYDDYLNRALNSELIQGDPFANQGGGETK